MHRSYQPILPCGNKYLQQKWDKTYYDEHKKKVQEARPMVDTNSPHTYAHLNLKLKKLKLEEERLSVIERDNRLLLEKMSTIMRTKGMVDNHNDYEAKSLNKEKREQELLKISRENQSILGRISKSEPQYKVEKWQEDWLKAEKYMDSIAKYPRGWYITPQEKMSKGKKKKLPKESITKKDKSSKEAKETRDKGEIDDKSKNKTEDANKTQTEDIKADKVQETHSKNENKVTNTSQSQAVSSKKEEKAKDDDNDGELEWIEAQEDENPGNDSDKDYSSDTSGGPDSEEETEELEAHEDAETANIE
ncbi:uncharacterized protein CFAP97D2 [Bombina bombina]|uniref:uncharacterized protein CFAP97D2 n=1 Tax=Bombina bombina TaxID=8345 RepID=UPI00235A63C1|nr:uncharacterized protein CFAP97D2 [Bombina bombina]